MVNKALIPFAIESPQMPPGGPRSSLAELIDLETFLRSPVPKHWVARRKAAVVLAVRTKLISLSDACVRYKLSVDELASWEAAFDSQGIAGLLAKRRIHNSKGPIIRVTDIRHTAASRRIMSEPRWTQYR
jgi:hypothetical protein